MDTIESVRDKNRGAQELLEARLTLRTKQRKGKRADGEGHVKQLPNGRWMGVMSGGWAAGKRIRRWLYGATQAEVIEKMSRAEEDLRAGHSLAIKRETVESYLNRWLEENARPRIKPRTYERFEELVRLHITPTIGQLRLEKLTPADVQRLLNRKQREGLAAQTVVSIRNVLRAALNLAIRWSLVSRNVAALVDAPRIERPAVQAMSPDEARKILDACLGSRHEAVYALALSTGARRGEVLGLMWTDIDLENSRVSITRSLQRVSGRLQLVETKTPKSRRTIPLPQYAIRALRAHRARQAEQRLAAGNSWVDSGLVFTNQSGGFIEPVNVLREFHRLLKNADLPKMKLHNLRHGTATLMLRERVPLKMIQELLGHSSIAVTSGFYAHLDEEFKRQGADAMDRVLGEHPPHIRGV